MNAKNNRSGYRGLLVKDVILPLKIDQRDAGPSKDVGKFLENHECRHTTSSSIKLGEHEITAFCGLVVLQKPPVEDYVLGTKNKKRIRKARGNKHPNLDLKLCSLVLQDNETLNSIHESGRNLPLAVEMWEEKTLKANIEKKIQNYENWMELQQEKNFRRQRCLEKESLKQQKDMARTWLGFIQSKEENRRKSLEECASRSLFKRHSNKQPEISLLARKCWDGETDAKTGKKPTNPGKGKGRGKVNRLAPYVLNGLNQEFHEKLVFVDDSDDPG